MTNVPPATLRLRIDTHALAANWRALDAMSDDRGGCQTAAAVKAKCYGLGVASCVPALRDAGAEIFFVAHWSEVADVAQHVGGDQICVLHGVGSSEEVEYAKSVGAVPVVNSIQQAEIWTANGGGRCHLMVDTGINRLGVVPDDLDSPAIQALTVDTILSHLACADEDSPMNEQQREAFDGALKLVRHERESLANSAGIALGSSYHYDLLRPGLALYGGVPRPEMADKIKQVAYPQAAIIQTRTLSAGDSVGYNALFTAESSMRVGVVSLGYADGFLRNWGERGFLRYDGADLPILGKVSMDMIVVDLTSAPSAAEGDWLDVPYHLPDASRVSGISQYELLTILGQRFDNCA